jgi:hypothetical protein
MKIRVGKYDYERSKEYIFPDEAPNCEPGSQK